ncbi:helix-turn-helix transcriptional regulator [Myroides sp. LJL115]
MKLAFNLRCERYRLELSQKELAEKLDITRVRYAKYEEGASEPPLWLLVKISDYLGVTIDDLVKEDLRKRNKQS